MINTSPWGKVNSCHALCCGLFSVTTDSHGGVMVSQYLARRCLSEAARNQATRYRNYYCYERDSLFIVPLFDSVYIRVLLLPTISYYSTLTSKKLESTLLKALSRFFPQYLKEKKLLPTAKEYSEYLLHQEYKKRCFGKCNNTILKISAYNDTLLKIVSADNTIYHATRGSFNRLKQHPIFRILMPLDGVEIVNVQALK